MSESLIGFRVEAADGVVGTVDPATPDTSEGFLVLLPEPHFFAKRLVLPTEVIEVDADAKIVRLSWTKEQLKDAAQFEDEDEEVPTDIAPFYDHELDPFTEP